MEIKELKRLMDAMAAADVAELEYEWDGTETTPGGRVALRRGVVADVVAPAPLVAPAAAVAPAPAAPAAASATEPAPAPAPAPKPIGVEVVAPIVGTFYASPAPDSGPFVKVGDRVKVGQVLCIIEAMKLMNEIESEVAGTVVEIAVRNEDPVEYGQLLFRIDPA
jgi:acetyl-CoA carboxylase biotin carboxyl carrier protein